MDKINLFVGIHVLCMISELKVTFFDYYVIRYDLLREIEK